MPDPIAATSGLISTRSTATPAEARWMAVAAPARPLPTTRALLTAGTEGSFVRLLDGDRVDRGADGAGHGQGGGGEPEVVAAVLGPVRGEPLLASSSAD